MSANIGKMFWYGEVPWHGEGTMVDHPLTLKEAIKAGDLGWEVETIPLQTLEVPPSPVATRMAIVRKDRSAGHPGRVVGVAHLGFVPLQNIEGARIFDAIFGRGTSVYHTGGYLGNGEKVWLLAKLPIDLVAGPEDKILPFALFSNSHDGSVAIDFRLTLVRVVCQNTLTLALSRIDPKNVFKHSHNGNYDALKSEAEKIFESTISTARRLEGDFRDLHAHPFPVDMTDDFLTGIFPFPSKPQSDVPSVVRRWSTRVNEISITHAKIIQLYKSGRGSDLPGVRGSAWGMFNAVLEFIDHHMKDSESGLIRGIWGNRVEMKRKAFAASLDLLKADMNQ